MCKLRRIKKVASLGVMAALLALSTTTSAAPYMGNEFSLKQPDGSRVPVKVFGNEYYQRVESLDGYTLIRDDEGWICYAELNEDSSDFVSTGILYDGISASTAADAQGDKSLPGLQKGLRLSTQARHAKMSAVRWSRSKTAAGGSATQTAGAFASDLIPGMKTIEGDVVGLTLLIDFSDDEASIDRDELDDFLNLPGYSGRWGNFGSARDYYLDVSSGKLNYTNQVTPYYRALHPKTYYDQADKYPDSTHDLIEEALTHLDAQGFDFSTLTTNENGHLIALNVYYAGMPDQGWLEGLWPHYGNLGEPFEIGGISVYEYQISHIGSELEMGTFVHENGHMLCGWPDTYDPAHDGFQSFGAGNYDLMATGATGFSNRNPVPPNAYFRYSCGWEEPVDITHLPAGTVLAHETNSYSSFKYTHPSLSNEFFFIESRHIDAQSRNHNIPDNGLLIWHIDTNGSNEYQQMTPEQHHAVSIEQADGKFDLEKAVNTGRNYDLFDPPASPNFNDFTFPNSKWWNGDASGLVISDIRSYDPDTGMMEFTIGETDTGPVWYSQRDSIGFSAVEIDSQKVKAFTIENNGNEPMVIDGVSFDDPEYTLQSTLPIVVPAYHSYDLMVEFTPIVTDYLYSTMTIESNATNLPIFEVELSGRGIIPPNFELSLSSNAIDFGSILPGEEAVAVLTLTNIGEDYASMRGYTFSDGSRFSKVDDTVVTIFAGESHDIEIVFAPTGVGEFTDTLTIETSSGVYSQSYTIALSGEGGTGVALDAALDINSEWGSGYCANISLVNEGNAPIYDWELLLNTNESVISNSWSASFVGDVGGVVLQPLNWNRYLGVGDSTSLGFCANKTGDNWRPSLEVTVQ